MKIKTLTVSEVNNYIKRMLDTDFILNNLSVRGEVSNLKVHSSGHIYFSLKDSSSKLNCVMFKNKASEIDFVMQDGMDVIACGRGSIYPGSGSLQLYVDDITENGVGALHIKFEKLKTRLSKEGYFDEEYKKSIPQMPLRVGVITSETGAVFQDIINVSRRRSRLVDIVLFPAQVQGKDAYKSIIKGLKFFNNKKNVDVIILGRGGGSIEELWNFNEEELAIEIFKSKIPTISAVGHETDFTISDFVCDLRAATPSQGAEIVIPLEKKIYEDISKIQGRIDELMNIKINNQKEKVRNLEKILMLNNPINIITNKYLEVDIIKDKIVNIIHNKINLEKNKVRSLSNLLQANNPINILEKGYVIIQNKNQEVISSRNQIQSNEEINITFKDGKIKGNFILSE